MTSLNSSRNKQPGSDHTMGRRVAMEVKELCTAPCNNLGECRHATWSEDTGSKERGPYDPFAQGSRKARLSLHRCSTERVHRGVPAAPREESSLVTSHRPRRPTP